MFRRERITHEGVRSLRVDIVGEAPVILEVVDVPACVRERILIFVAIAAGIATAGEITGITVDTEFHALGMGIRSESLDSGWELLFILMDEALLIPLSVPTVIYVHIDVASIDEAELHHLVDGVHDELFIDVGHEAVP